ncbi:unnamed protein product [Caenorhabditis angaria]|uniref:Uncharacterized protein n=1 Tax=Caenorhabditis angaria TaxID=860376 RepID=A0A9P1IBU2_9PELO|nr:unnamed protein product [Caenorhabditis angaria]
MVTPPKIDFADAIQDSPKFRATISQHTIYFNRLESRLNEILRHINQMIDQSKNYVQTFYKLTVSVNQLCDESFSDNPLATKTFEALSDAYGHTLTLLKTYYEHSNIVIYQKLSGFIKNELQKVVEARAHFDNMSQSMDEALIKNASGSRQKPADAADGRNALTAVGACFAHTTLDYVAQINIAHAHKDHMILEALWTFVRESSAFFSKGHATFDEWTAADNGYVADTIHTFASKSKLVERKMQDVHSLVPKEMFQHPSGMPIDADVMMEGYLYKRSSNAFKTWNRRWFQIKENKLLYSHRSNDVEPSTVMEENLMLCLVRPAPPNIDRVGCFELVTPTRSHLLQADSESLCNDWMRALQRTILALHESDNGFINSSRGSATVPSTSKTETDLNKNRSLSDPIDSSSPRSTSSNTSTINQENNGKLSTFEQIRRVEGNEKCADCGSASPKWVSINIGVILCIECSGVHRSLGVQMSKVRSLTMDSIDGELKDVLLALGNNRVNSIFLKYLPETDIIPPPANETSTRQVREAWIKAKYVEKRFAKNTKAKISINKSASYKDVLDAWSADLSMPLPTIPTKRLSSCGSDTALDLVGESEVLKDDWKHVKESCENGNILGLLEAFSQGFDLNAHHEGTTALHIATKHGHTGTVEFLLLNGAKINMLDEKLNTALHLAAQEGHTLQVCQLLKRGADGNLTNVDSKTPLDIAMEGTHADIVTLFRVTIMRNEFNDYNNPMDETVDVVISDIANRAANEKLNKSE